MRAYPREWRKEASWLSQRLRTYGVAVAVLSLLISPGALAATITYDLIIEFSGATPPEGPTPWLTATFDDGGTPGSVALTLEAANLTDNEFVFEWLFNLDPVLDPTNLDFTNLITTGAFTDPTVNFGANAYMANGDGFFDIQILFDYADGADARFGVGEAAQYTIIGIDTLTAYSFDFLSFEDGGVGEYPTAAHVGGIGPSDDDSGWISVPEPGTLSLLALGGLFLTRRRR